VSGRALVASVALVSVLAAGCGYIKAGTWEDDPKNWKRAFDQTKPEGVVVVHSKYWRGAHWTYECAYSFEIEVSPAVREELFRGDRLRRSAEVPQAEWKDMLGPHPPEWFCPKPADRYEVWVYTEEPVGNFKHAIDPETGHLFLNDYQL
jgi:hypothetical protein